MKEGNNGSNENKNSDKIKEKSETTRISLMNELKSRQNKKNFKIKENGSLENLYKKKEKNVEPAKLGFNLEKRPDSNGSEEIYQNKDNHTPMNSHRTFIKLKNGKEEEINNNEILNQRKIYVDLNNNYLNEVNINQNNDDIIINQRHLYCNNSIRTCQYTLITFLPLALLNQFKTAFNWFFLICVIITCIPILSDKSVAADVTPFIVVILISLIKEAIEDYRKYKNDKTLNNATVLIFKENRFFREKCQNIKVGNIIKIYKDDVIPADVLIIKSSFKNGLCYMQTANLDGETALKPREAFNFTQNNVKNKSKIIQNLFNYQDGNFYIEALPPNKNLYDIEGTVFVNKNKNYITIKNVLLRGARLKNVDYIYGIVLYSGHDTKLMQNIGHSSLKMSSIDKKLNYIILIIFFICLIINIISSVVGSVLRDSLMPDYDKGDINAEYVFYYRDKKTRKDYLEIIRIASNNFLIYSTFIPISIIISNAFCKVFQTIYLQQFSPEYKEDKDDKIKCFSTGLLDELGNVKYIFSDKTGTLTKNEMLFRGCSIYTQLFDDSPNNNTNSITNDSYFAQNILNLQNPQNFFNFTPSKKNISFNESTKGWTNFSKISNSKISENFAMNTLLKFLQNKSSSNNVNYQKGIPFNNIQEACEHFFINIIINHDVLIEKNQANEITFQGPSPDEITLVSAAYEFGFCFLSRENGIISIKINEQFGYPKPDKKFKILQKFDFTSERQCSSIIVQDLSSNKILLYIKGSDRKIFKNLENYSMKNIYKKTKEHLDKFAKQGLRTLCYGFKYIDEKYYKKWEKDYKEAKYKSLENKQLSGLVDVLIDKMESNIILLGVSALEDKLQDEVEKDIKKFIDAGINFWMITGDKMDTAESIGYSCGIFSEDCEVYKIKDTDDVKQVIKEMKEISKNIDTIDYELNNITKNHHKQMVKNKIIPNDEKFRRIRKRYYSVNMERGALDNIIYSKENEKEKEKEKNDRRSMIVNPINNIKKSHFKVEEEQKIESINDFLKNNKNQDDNSQKNQVIKININNDNYYINNGNNEHFNTLNKDNEENYNNINTKRKVTKLVKQTYEGSVNSKSSDNKIIFKYVAQNVDNESNYGNISMIKDDVKKYQQSINSKIFGQSDNSCNLSSSNYININEEEKKDDIERNLEDKENNEVIKSKNIKRYKDIPLEEKNFNEYFDFCQNELYKNEIKHSERLQLFNIKYLYPQPQITGIIFKKIKSKFSLMLEGSAITTCMQDGESAELFWNLIQRSRSLICCRASPSQKSQIVEFIKKNTDSITLAIGDGGNDVNMIRTSNVGIGIFGKEGYQAAYNSDYAISQFKYLKRLLFYDGRITLARNCYFLYHYFFKNFIFTLVLFWFGIDSCFSGGNYYDDYYSMGFNSFATVILLIIYEILHEDFDPDFNAFNDKEKNLLKNILPDIFKEYRDSLPFNLLKFTVLSIIACLFSYICYSIPIYSYDHNFYGYDLKGYQLSIWDTSFASYISIIIIHYFIIFIDTHNFKPGIIIFYIFQLILTLCFLLFCDQANDNFEIYNSLTLMLSNILTWLTIIITSSFCLLFFYIVRRGEFYFGEFIANNITQKRFKDYFIEKFYQKKVDQMTRVVRSVAKFKRIYYNPIEDDRDDNLADQKMRKFVNEFRDMKNTFMKRSKSYMINEN